MGKLKIYLHLLKIFVSFLSILFRFFLHIFSVYFSAELLLVFLSLCDFFFSKNLNLEIS